MLKSIVTHADTFAELNGDGHTMAARSGFFQRFFRRGIDNTVYFVPDGSAEEQRERCERLLQQAAYHWRRGEYPQALEYVAAAVAVDPEYEEALTAGVYYAIEAESSEALAAAFERVPEPLAERMPFVALRAVLAATQGDKDKVRTLLEKARAIDAKHPAVLFAAAEVFRRAHVWGQAAELYRQLYAVHKDFPYGHLQAARVFMALGKFTDAVECLETRLRTQPRNADLYHLLGVCYEALGQTSRALQSYREALSIDPDRSETHFRLGRLERTIGHYIAAVQHLRFALNSNPELLEIHQELITVLLALEQWGEAARLLPMVVRAKPSKETIEAVLHVLSRGVQEEVLQQCLEEAAKLHPANPWVHYGRGVIYLRKQRFAEAQSALEESLRLRPTAAAHLALGLVHSQQGNVERAIEEFTRAIELDSSNIVAWKERSRAYAQLQRLTDALADVAQALQLDPNSGELYYLKARYLVELGRPQEALETLNVALHRDPSCVDAWLLASQLWRARGEYAQAIYALKQALSIRPDDSTIHIAMAETQLAIGRFSAAKQHIERVLQLRPQLGEQLYLLLGKSLESRNLYHRALELYESAVSVFPQSADLRFRYGYAALRCGVPHVCLRQIEYLTGIDPARAAALEELYQAYSSTRGR